MVAVDGIDGVKYGFRLLGYLLVVVVLGGVLMLVGAGFTPGPFRRGNPILAMVFVLAGVSLIYAGGLGLLYKVIADGVEAGNVAADRGGRAPVQQPPADQPPPGGHQQQPPAGQGAPQQGGHGGQPNRGGRQ